MATVYRCDRCKKIGEAPEYLTPVVVPAIVDSLEELRIGLCSDCLTLLHGFAKNQDAPASKVAVIG